MNKFIVFLGSIAIIILSCNKDDDMTPGDIDFRQEMRDFVIAISHSAKLVAPSFLIIPQNGIELVSQNGEEDGPPHTDYLNAIDGNGQEDLFYGYNNDDDPTPNNENVYLRSFLNISKNYGNAILVTDYCSTQSNMEDSYDQNTLNGYISFAADHRELNNIPSYPNPVFQENTVHVQEFSQVKNFLYLINLEGYNSKSAFINAVTSTNYDLVIMDLFFNDGTAFTGVEINQLRVKANGGSRLVVCYMSIGEAEDYRYYWNPEWNTSKPAWLDDENPDWAGNFKVRYWEDSWQKIIYGNNEAYLTKILDAGFDGVYLDIIDAFEYFE